MGLRTIIEEALKTQIHVVLGLLVLWIAIGLVAGIVLAIAAYKLLGRLGAWRLDWKHGNVLRVLTAVWLVLAFGLCGAWIGGAQGLIFGVERVVRDSQFHDRILIPVGQVAADGFMIVDFNLKNMDPETYDVPPPTDEQREFLQAFQEGHAELNVKEFQERLVTLRDHMMDEVVADLKADLKKRIGLEAGPLAESLLDRLLHGLAQHAWKRESKKKLGPILECYHTLPDAAGDDGMISRSALANHLIERGAVPAIMKPTRYAVRGVQIPWAIGMAGALIPPLVLFWLIRWFERRRAREDSASGVSLDDPEVQR